MSIKMQALSSETQTKLRNFLADGKLTVDEWNKFSPKEQEELSEGLGGKAPTEDNPLKLKITTKPAEQTDKSKTESKKSNWFSDWLNDKDKVSTDGKDDGSISFGEAMKSMGKGLIGIVKGAIKHPITTVATIGTGVALTVATGGAALPVLIALGAGTGAVMIGKGTYDAVTAKTDGEAKAAYENIGNGIFALGASALGAKASLNAASTAGVTGADGASELNTVEALAQNFKVLPEALKVSGQNIEGNVLTLATGNVHAHSNQLQGSNAYMSKANDVQAYRFNPNGTPEEILANNPGVFRGADGKYYLPNKWSPEEPYLIDTSKEQMIMLYGGDDMAVCDGAVFKGSYVDTQSFKADQALNYQDPTQLTYGEVVNVTKQAPGAFKVMPEGTKVETLEGTRTVGKGEVVALDHEGNPYVTTPANILKRNTGLSDDAMNALCDMDPAAVYKHNPTWLETNRPVDFDIQETMAKVPEELKTDAMNVLTQNVKEIETLGGKFIGYENSPIGNYCVSREDQVYAGLLVKKGYTVESGPIHEYYRVDRMEYIIVNGKRVAPDNFVDYAKSLLLQK
jgi:hypothetical protein